MENFLYEDFCKRRGSFMQSQCWAKVKSGWLSETVTVEDKNGEIIGTALALLKPLPLGLSFMYAPRGFVCDFHNQAVLAKLLEQLKKLAKQHHALMLKIDPLIDEHDDAAIQNLKALGFLHRADCVGYENVQCRENYMLDISKKSKDEVFDGFKSKWRYNIRLAKRRGVQCDFYGEERLDDFVALMQQTAARDGFEMRGKEYFRTILKSFEGRAKLCMCYLDEAALSGALCIEYGGVLSYVYGCSSNDNRRCMPNYLMQWTMIETAIDHGCHTYDFCGVPYWYNKSHKNYGVYRFKRGFGGYVKTYAGEFDYYFRPATGRLFNALLRHQKRS